MSKIFNLILYGEFSQHVVPVKLETLTPELQELFKPFIGKTVTLTDNKIIETEIKNEPQS